MSDEGLGSTNAPAEGKARLTESATSEGPTRASPESGRKRTGPLQKARGLHEFKRYSSSERALKVGEREPRGLTLTRSAQSLRDLTRKAGSDGGEEEDLAELQILKPRDITSKFKAAGVRRLISKSSKKPPVVRAFSKSSSRGLPLSSKFAFLKRKDSKEVVFSDEDTSPLSSGSEVSVSATSATGSNKRISNKFKNTLAFSSLLPPKSPKLNYRIRRSHSQGSTNKKQIVQSGDVKKTLQVGGKPKIYIPSSPLSSSRKKAVRIPSKEKIQVPTKLKTEFKPSQFLDEEEDDDDDDDEEETEDEEDTAGEEGSDDGNIVAPEDKTSDVLTEQLTPEQKIGKKSLEISEADKQAFSASPRKAKPHNNNSASSISSQKRRILTPGSSNSRKHFLQRRWSMNSLQSSLQHFNSSNSNTSSISHTSNASGMNHEHILKRVHQQRSLIAQNELFSPNNQTKSPREGRHERSFSFGSMNSGDSEDGMNSSIGQHSNAAITLQSQVSSPTGNIIVENFADAILLKRGGVYVDTSVGPIQFGIPPETIKDPLDMGLPVPRHYVVPKERFDLRLGINVAEIEFPAYYNFFLKQQQVTLITTPEVETIISQILGETLEGPAPENVHTDSEYHIDVTTPIGSLRRLSDLEISSSRSSTSSHVNGSHSKARLAYKARPDHIKEMNYFKRPRDGVAISVKSAVNFIHFKPIMGGIQEILSSLHNESSNSEGGVSVANIVSQHSFADLEHSRERANTPTIVTFVAKVGENVYIEDTGSEYLVWDQNALIARIDVFLASWIPPAKLDKQTFLPTKVVDPPLFGVTVLGASHGFDPKASTSGFVLWINKKGIMVDPPPNSTEVLHESGIVPGMCDSIILTHCHADHDAGTFQKILTEGRVTLMTTKTVMDQFLRKYSLISGFTESFLGKLFQPKHVKIGEPVEYEEATIQFFYTLHALPCVGFEVMYEGKTFIYSADTFYDPDRLRELQEEGVLSKERCNALINFPWHYDVVMHEAGIPPIHTPVSVLQQLSQQIKDHLYIIHITEQAAAVSGLRLAKPGMQNTIRIIDEGADDVDDTLYTDDLLLRLIENDNVLFKNFTKETAKDFVDLCSRQEYAQGEVVCHAGEVGSEFFVILRGFAAVELGTSSKETTTAANIEIKTHEQKMLSLQKHAATEETIYVEEVDDDDNKFELNMPGDDTDLESLEAISKTLQNPEEEDQDSWDDNSTQNDFSEDDIANVEEVPSPAHVYPSPMHQSSGQKFFETNRKSSESSDEDSPSQLRPRTSSKTSVLQKQLMKKKYKEKKQKQEELNQANDGKAQHALKLFGPGDYLGELVMLETGSVRSATIRAITQLTVIVFDQDSFRYLLEMNPELEATLQKIAKVRTSASWKAIEANSIFCKLAAAPRTNLQSILTKRSVTAETVLWELDEPVNVSCLIGSGEMTFIEMHDELEQSFTTGAFLCNISSILNQKMIANNEEPDGEVNSSVTLIALTNCELYIIENDDIVLFLNKNPGILINLIDSLVME